ncbi:hypothetical protein ACA910_010064 [Epithemia clementina (nom. ined.)]
MPSGNAHALLSGICLPRPISGRPGRSYATPSQNNSVDSWITEGWEVTEKEKRDMEMLYKMAKPGDHLKTPYKCELCHFQNMFHRNPDKGAAEDDRVMACITQAILGAFLSRRPSTVKNNLQEMQRVMRISNSMHSDSFEAFKISPFPPSNTFGMAAAIISLQRSSDWGKNSRTIQWDTMQGVRSVMSYFVHTMPKGVGGIVISDGKCSTHITHCNTNTLWFKHFMDGCHKRMGDVKVQDTAMTIDVLICLQDIFEQR